MKVVCTNIDDCKSKKCIWWYFTRKAIHIDSDDLSKYFWSRELSSREYWRLMGFTDEDYDKSIYGDTSAILCIRQAGNSIVVQALEAILQIY